MRKAEKISKQPVLPEKQEPQVTRLETSQNHNYDDDDYEIAPQKSSPELDLNNEIRSQTINEANNAAEEALEKTPTEQFYESDFENEIDEEQQLDGTKTEGTINHVLTDTPICGVSAPLKFLRSNFLFLITKLFSLI